MTEMPAAEARDRIDEVLARVEAGETVRVTRNGRIVARIEPEEVVEQDDPDRAETLNEALSKLDDFRKSAGQWATIEEILAWRHEGHKY